MSETSESLKLANVTRKLIKQGHKSATIENHNRAVNDAFDYAKVGGVIDLTSLMCSKEVLAERR